MKKTFLILATVLISATAFAQVIKGIPYQTVVKDETHPPVINKTVGMRISVIQGSIEEGTVVYVEVQKPTTDAHGAVNIIVGNGTTVAGDLDAIDFARGVYYIKTESNINGTTDFNDAQSLIVAFGLLPRGDIRSGPTASGGAEVGMPTKHYVGEFYGGGIVFYVSKDSSGVEHGLIAGLTDLSDACVWSNITLTLIGPEAESTTNGRANTAAIIEQEGHKRSAALLCDTSTSGGQTDWYLPAMQEMNILWNNLYAVNKVINDSKRQDATPIAPVIYWTSTEDEATTFAWYFGMYDSGPDGDTAGNSDKNELYHVRAIRAF